MVEGADVLKELGRHVIIGPCGLGRRRELDACVSPNQLEDVVGILCQCFILTHHIIVNDARVAQGVYPLPVLIERFLPLRPRIQQVVHKLLKLHIVAMLQGLVARVLPMPPDYLGPVTLMERCIVAPSELVAVGRDQSFKRLPHKDELEVVTQAIVDLRSTVLGERTQVGGYVSLIGGDFQWVLVLALPR